MAFQQISGHASLKEKHRIRRDVWQDTYLRFEPSTKTLRLYSLNTKAEVVNEVYSTEVLDASVPQPKLG